MEENKAKHEVGAEKPTSLKHIIGQANVKAQVTTALNAAWADKRKFPSSMLLGPPGVGKSALADVIAAEMGVGEAKEVLGQSLKKPCHLNALLLEARDKDVVHIDECHQARPLIQTALYLAIDKRKIIVPGSSGIDALPIADFTLLLSTTDEYRLLQPLRDRMRLVLQFEFYSIDELAEILRQRASALRWEVDPAIFLAIATRSRGTPRIALRLLESARGVCRSGEETFITMDHLVRACTLDQLDSLGLRSTEQKYLRLLADGPCRLNVIASMLGLPSLTVRDVTEPFLIRSGLILKDDQGHRQLTADGREHILRPTAV